MEERPVPPVMAPTLRPCSRHMPSVLQREENQAVPPQLRD